MTRETVKTLRGHSQESLQKVCDAPALMACSSCACADRKLAKSTLVLVLVFGIHYIVFVGMPHASNGLSWEVRMYCELFFNSFQVIGTLSPSSLLSLAAD